MINVRQETKVVIEFDDAQIQSFAKLIAGVYNFNNSEGFGFQLKQKINLDDDVNELVMELATVLGLDADPDDIGDENL